MAARKLQGAVGKPVLPKVPFNKMPAYKPAVAGMAPAAPALQPIIPALQPDATMIAQQAANQASYGSVLGSLNNQELGVRQAYGFDDASNPFSRAQLLKQAYENRGRANTNSFASSGQLYSGALQNAQDTSARQNEQDVDSARRSYASDLAAIADRRAGARTALDQGNINAFASSIDRQLAVRPAGDPDSVASVAPVAAPKATGGKVLTGAAGKLRKPKVAFNQTAAYKKRFGR